MRSTAKTVSCICGTTVKLTDRDRAAANVYRECPKCGMRPVDRGSVDAQTGVVRHVRGAAPRVMAPEKE